MITFTKKNIENKVVDGDITVYYLFDSVLYGNGVVGEISNFQMSNDSVNFRYRKVSGLRWGDVSYVDVDYNGASWSIRTDDKGVVQSIDLHICIGPNYKKARDWKTANEDLWESPQRLERAQVIFDYFSAIINQRPVFQEHLNGFKKYSDSKDEALKEKLDKQNEEEDRKKQPIIEQYRGKPDPLAHLVEIVNSMTK